MDKTVILKRVIMGILTLLAIAYVVYTVTRANIVRVETVEANLITVHDAIRSQGYVIRSEHYITYDGDGILSYTISDGEKISKNETIANVYTDAGSAGKSRESQRLEAQIESLTLLNKTAEALTVSPDALDKNISSLLCEINLHVADGSLSEADSRVESVLYGINERQLVTGKVQDYTDKIAELEVQKKELDENISAPQKAKKITSGYTGYFVSAADGYEGQVGISEIPGLTAEALSTDQLKPVNVNENVVGKVIDSVYWYIACPMNAEELLKIKQSRSLFLDIPLVSNEPIEVELYAINQQNSSADGVAIFRGLYMSAEMASVRRADVSVIVKTYTGLYIPKSAVHDADVSGTQTDKYGKTGTTVKTVSGVYIKKGSEVKFREVLIIYSGDDFVISDYSDYNENPGAPRPFSDDYGRVEQYDNIITEGANLYDGKII